MTKLHYDIGYAGWILLTISPLLLQIFTTYGVIIYIFFAGIYLLSVQATKIQIEKRLKIKGTTPFRAYDVNDPSILQELVDQNVLKHVMENFPGYCNDPAMERCDWANKGMLAAFPYAAAFEGRKMHAKLVRKLSEMKGPVKIEITQLDAGEVPPVCTGVKVLDYKNDLKVIMEGDVVYNGLPCIEIKVTAFGYTITILIHEITLCAQLRLTIGPLYVGATPAKALGISFKKLPYVHFQMKVCGVDIMHLGPGPLQLFRLIEPLMKKVLNQEFMYPNVSWSEFDKSYDLKTLPPMDKPLGLLAARIISGKDLVIADTSTSDPYVKINIGIEERSTRIIYKSLNPVWDETFVMAVSDIDLQILEIFCFDHDLIGSDDPLGNTSFKIKELEFYEKVLLDLPLENVAHGSIQLELLYIPLDSDVDATVRKYPDAPEIAKQYALEFLADGEEDNTVPTNVISPGNPDIERQTSNISDISALSADNDSNKIPTKSFFGLSNKKKIRTSNFNKGHGAVLFDIISCINLPAHSKTCSAFVEFKFDDIKKGTEIQHGTNCPFFWKNVIFVIPSSQKNDVISIKIKNTENNHITVIGTCRINVNDIIEAGLIEIALKVDPSREDILFKARVLWNKPSLKPRVRRPNVIASPIVISPDAKYI